MIRLRPRSVTVSKESEERLTAAAQALLGGAQREESLRLFVQFGLPGGLYAVELSLVERAITHFGEVVPLANASRRIRGTAFLDGVPHVLIDLQEAVGALPRALRELERSPALVMNHDGVPLALSVHGPLELTEMPFTAGTTPSQEQSGVEIAGQLPNGVLVLAPHWLRSLLAGLA